MTRLCVRFAVLGVVVLLGLACGHRRAVCQEVPKECVGPEWLSGGGVRGGQVRGIGGVEAAREDVGPEEKLHALTDAVRNLLVEYNRGEMRVLSFFSQNAPSVRASGHGGSGSLPQGLAGCLGELVSKVTKHLETDYWYDPCLGRLWCFAMLDAVDVGKVTESLLARNDLDAVLDQALKDLAAQAGVDARRLVVYQVLDADGIAEGPMGEAFNAALVRIATAERRFDVVPKETLDRILRSAKADLGGLAFASTSLFRQANEVADVILVGTYRKADGVVRLDLVLVDSRYRPSGSVPAYVFETALPEPVRQSAREFEALLKEQNALEDAETREADKERRRLEEQKLAELTKEARARVEREMLPKIQAKLEEKYRKQYEEKFQSSVAQAMASLREDLRKQGVAQREEQDRRLKTQLALIMHETRKTLELQTAVQKQRELQQRVDIAASDVAAAKFQAYLGGSTPDSPLRVSTYLDRGCGATYRVGEEAVLFTRCNRDCYVKVFHRAQDGAVTLLFPNKKDWNNHLQGGVVHAIGDESYPFLFRIREPLGIERVVVVAQETQFNDIEKVKAEYSARGMAGYGKQKGSGYGQVLYRGMVPEARPGRAATGTARSTCSLVVERAGRSFQNP